MLVIIFGVYAFTFGRVRLPWELCISGWRSRASGLFLVASLPILILLGKVISQGVDEQTVLSLYGIMELVRVLLSNLGTVFPLILLDRKIKRLIRGKIICQILKSGFYINRFEKKLVSRYYFYVNAFTLTTSHIVICRFVLVATIKA